MQLGVTKFKYSMRITSNLNGAEFVTGDDKLTRLKEGLMDRQFPQVHSQRHRPMTNVFYGTKDLVTLTAIRLSSLIADDC